MQLITKEELADLIFENKESMYRLAYTIVEMMRMHRMLSGMR